MIEVNYNSELDEDIRIANKEGKNGDIIITGIISDILSIVIGLPIVYFFNRLMKVEMNWAISIVTLTILETIATIRQIKKSIKSRRKKVSVSKENIYFLSRELNNSEELTDKYANNQVPTVSMEDIISSVTTKEKRVEKNATYGEDEIVKSIKTIVTDFYMLDSEDQLKVLREVREKIKTEDDTINKTNLYLLEDEDIPSVLPVKRTLERK